ncbi:VIT family protein [Candidatus Saccharibacteria bacterium]|nr:VIT family protein [Candidatus Saccharibacteria bacterium]
MESSTQKESTNALLNKLRAAVLGANDGVVSTSAVVMGVAGASSDNQAIATAGFAALVAGALSMAVGEYVSVSSQSDTEKAFIHREKRLLRKNPIDEERQLAKYYESQGVSAGTAKKVAADLHESNALQAHLRMHFGIDEDDLNSPLQAAIASLVAFTAGGLVPFLAVILAPDPYKLIATFVAVLVALIATGYFSAKVGEAHKLKAIVRIVIGGALAMLLTYGIGTLFGTAI